MGGINILSHSFTSIIKHTCLQLMYKYTHFKKQKKLPHLKHKSECKKLNKCKKVNVRKYMSLINDILVQAI